MSLQRHGACQEVCGPTVPRSIEDHLLFFFSVCMCGCFNCTHICAPYACLAPGETRNRVELEVTSSCELVGAED